MDQRKATRHNTKFLQKKKLLYKVIIFMQLKTSNSKQQIVVHGYYIN